MVEATIQAIFAIVSGLFARYCLPRGWMFLRMGWFAIRTFAESDDTRPNIERQRGMSSGTSFFIGGLGWLTAGILSAAACVILLVLAIRSAGII